ncbi:hypothetical protein MMC25_007334 [Agyrium rufum]|nr:hypothetical protein [Agyrium rufum]
MANGLWTDDINLPKLNDVLLLSPCYPDQDLIAIQQSLDIDQEFAILESQTSKSVVSSNSDSTNQDQHRTRVEIDLTNDDTDCTPTLPIAPKKRRKRKTNPHDLDISSIQYNARSRHKRVVPHYLNYTEDPISVVEIFGEEYRHNGHKGVHRGRRNKED